MWKQFGHTFAHASATLLDCHVHKHKQLGYTEKVLSGWMAERAIAGIAPRSKQDAVHLRSEQTL